MLLEINLQQKQGMSCEESGLATVSLWLKRRYEMIFSQNWNFKLTEPNPQVPGSIGRRIVVEKGDIFQLIEQYHGIRTTRHFMVHSPEIFEVASREIKAGFPIAVIFDYQYLSLVPPKKRMAQFRNFPMLVIGIDHSRQNVYCLDIHFLKKVIVLSFENFCQGYAGFMTFSVIGDEKTVDWREVIQWNTDRLIKDQTFDALRTLSRLITESLDFSIENEKEFIDNVEPVISEKITTVYNSRFLFSQTLAYLIDFQKAPILGQFQDGFMKLSSQWLSVWSILTMAFRQRELNVQRDFEAQMRKVSQKILDIAGLEEELCGQVIQTMDGHPGVFKKRSYSKDLEAPADPIRDFQCIDISGYLNNEGFASSMEPGVTADFNGSGQFFLTEDLPLEEIWDVKGLKFRFPHPMDGVKDNIACMGQAIELPQDYYRALILLGCVDWGHKSEILEIHYAGGERVSLPLEFPNWTYTSSFSGELLVWEGRCAERIGDVVSPITLYKGHLFAQTILLDGKFRLERITLPHCSYIHLFAITLGR